MTIRPTTSYEISYKLHKAGFKGKLCGFWFAEGGFTFDYQKEYDWAAYSFESILASLPKNIKLGAKRRNELRIYFETDDVDIDESTCFIGYQHCQGFRQNLTVQQQKSESLADTAARLWLKLKEEGLV